MIFRTKVLGGGGYNVAKNNSITPKNKEDNCRNLQDNCNFLQITVNVNIAANVASHKKNKNQINCTCYKTKSNYIFCAILLFVWFLALITTLFSIVSLYNQQKAKTLYAVPSNYTNFYFKVDETLKSRFSTFTITFGGTSVDCSYSNSSFSGEDKNHNVESGAQLLIVPEAPDGYLWKNTDTGVVYSKGNINENVEGVPRKGSDGVCDINIELVKVAATTSKVSINISITGDYKSDASGLILYIMQNNVVQSQIVANNNVPIILTQEIGKTYTILVSKPYMWTMTVSGCTQDSDNKNKITYSVASTAQTITLEFSGGCASNMIAV